MSMLVMCDTAYLKKGNFYWIKFTFASITLAPRCVRHSYLSKEATIDPLYLWVIKTFLLRRNRGVMAWGEYSRVCLFALSLSNFYLMFLVVFYI